MSSLKQRAQLAYNHNPPPPHTPRGTHNPSSKPFPHSSPNPRPPYRTSNTLKKMSIITFAAIKHTAHYAIFLSERRIGKLNLEVPWQKAQNCLTLKRISNLYILHGNENADEESSNFVNYFFFFLLAFPFLIKKQNCDFHLLPGQITAPKCKTQMSRILTWVKFRQT